MSIKVPVSEEALIHIFKQAHCVTFYTLLYCEPSLTMATYVVDPDTLYKL